VTSCVIHFSIGGACIKGLNPTGRVLVYDLLEFTIVHCREVVTTDVLLELRIRPGTKLFRRSYIAPRGLLT